MLCQAPTAPFLALVGPTAVGKTAISLRIADRLNAEIISADSRQIYRELTIGTAKPSLKQLGRVPHHFIGELELNQPFSAGAFARRAHARIASILHSGRVPLVVGGSTLYLQALLHGLSAAPPSTAPIRQMLEDRLKQKGQLALYEELTTIDPISASALDPTKTHRVIRALEVYHQTGKTLSSFQEHHTPPPYPFDVVVLSMNRSRLYERINLRVDRMMAAGLLNEVRAIRAAGHKSTTPALRAIGYQEAFAHLDGDITEEEMICLIKRNSRRYAKRQLTWFRRYDQDHWIDLDDPDSPRPPRWHDVFNYVL